MYVFKTSTGKQIGGPVATLGGALSMALHLANKRHEPITVVCPNGERRLINPSPED